MHVYGDGSASSSKLSGGRRQAGALIDGQVQGSIAVSIPSSAGHWNKD
jgi:hypothetical protein